MPEFTTNQWAILFLTLVLGWLLGLLSRSGGGRWRREYEREHAERLALENTHREHLQTRDARIAELERTPPAAAAGAGAVGATRTAPAGHDDLSLIRGIGRTGEARLNEVGIHRYEQIATLSANDEVSLEERLDLERGTIRREGWREQADLLASGRSEEQRRRWA
jgi:predicted flap endonuclease-1-like 5' DNA nuclease